MRNLIVFLAMMRTDQTQHCLEIRPILFEGVSRHGRCLSRCFIEKRLQTVTILDARFCVVSALANASLRRAGLLYGLSPSIFFRVDRALVLPPDFVFTSFIGCYESRLL